MEKSLTVFLRVMLWISTVSGAIFGVGLYLAPVAFNQLVGVETADPVAVACLGGFLTAAAFASYLCLRSGKWNEIRIAVYYLITWNILNATRLIIALASGKEGLMPNAVSTVVVGLGLAYAAWLQTQQSVSVKNKSI